MARPSTPNPDHPGSHEEVKDEAAPQGVYGRLERVELRFTQVGVVLMTLLVLTSAISRTVAHPQSWAVDLATFCFAWSVFVGADVALRRGKMISIELVTNRMPKRVVNWVDVVNSTIIIVFLLAMIGFGLYLSYTTRSRSFSGLPWLSYTWVTLSVPVGCGLMLYTMSRVIRDQFRKAREGVETECLSS